MGDTEAYEEAAGESSSVIDRAQTAVLEMREVDSRTNADSQDVSDTDAKLNTALHRAVLSVCGNGENRNVSYRQLDELMTSQNIKLNTALHRSVLSVCGNGENRAGSYGQLCTLMTSQNIKLNTALHLSVLSVCGNGKNGAGSYRLLDKLMTNQKKN